MSVGSRSLPHLLSGSLGVLRTSLACRTLAPNARVARSHFGAMFEDLGELSPASSFGEDAAPAPVESTPPRRGRGRPRLGPPAHAPSDPVADANDVGGLASFLRPQMGGEVQQAPIWKGANGAGVLDADDGEELLRQEGVQAAPDGESRRRNHVSRHICVVFFLYFLYFLFFFCILEVLNTTAQNVLNMYLIGFEFCKTLKLQLLHFSKLSK